MNPKNSKEKNLFIYLFNNNKLKIRSQSLASQKYRSKKKAITDEITKENIALKTDIRTAQHTITTLMQENAVLQTQLYPSWLKKRIERLRN